MNKGNNYIVKKVFNWSFFRWDHLAVCAMLWLFGWLLLEITTRISLFDPFNAAINDFYMTDVFFEIQNKGSAVHNNDIVIVDMTDLRTRDDIAQTITDIKSCHPKVLGVDIIFERRSFDDMDDAALISAIENGDCPQIFSCKLRDYNNQDSVFKDCLYSFFQKVNKEWGYTNYKQERLGGVTRKTSQRQNLNDSVVYSFPYLLACKYAGRQPIEEIINERTIMYMNVVFDSLKSTEVMQHKEMLKDKLVLLGAKNEEADMHFSPIGKKSGMEVIAYSILSYLNHDETTKMSEGTSLLLTFILCFIAAWMGYKIERWNSVFFPILAKIFNFGLVVVLIGIALYLFVDYNYYVDLPYPLLGLAFTEDIRELYAGIIKWAVGKKKIAFLKSSIYAEM